jgi:endonuclease YncB( thermonuclease family)
MVNEPGYGQVQVEIAGISTPGIGAGVPALAVKAGAMLAGRTVTVTSAIKVELGGAGQDRHRYKEATVTVGGEDLAEKLVSAGLATRRS